jgi:hypothetical protein
VYKSNMSRPENTYMREPDTVTSGNMLKFAGVGAATVAVVGTAVYYKRMRRKEYFRMFMCEMMREMIRMLGDMKGKITSHSFLVVEIDKSLVNLQQIIVDVELHASLWW